MVSFEYIDFWPKILLFTGRGYPLTRYDFCTPRNFFLLGATRDRTREGQGKRHHSKPMRRFPQLRHQGGAVIAIIVAICLSVGCSYGKQFHLLYDKSQQFSQSLT